MGGMASDSESLASLENLLNEFFHGDTINERKRQIEELLNNFGLQDGSWRQCIFFLNNSTNDYVLMYSLSIFETMVTQRWHGTQGNDKQQIRKFLYDFLMRNYAKVPTFIRNKSIKVLVNIGRYDWPMFYPMFFSNIMQLLQNTDTTLIGVIALQMVSEEFISPREDLSMSRRVELKDSLLQHIPNALHTLTELLNTILLKFKRVAQTVTPPPSPNAQSPLHSPYQSPRHSPSHRITLSTVQTTILAQEIISPTIPLERNTEELCTNIFTCLAQYISWLPLSRFITPTLVAKIFNFAEFGCSASAHGSASAGSQIGIHAMACINEILSKKFVPAEYEAFLLQMFQQTFSLLQVISKGNSTQMTGNALANLDESYIEKFTEFLNLFVGNHLKRFEPNHHFPTVELFYLLLKYTMVQQSPEMFVACLDVWSIVLDYLIDNVTSCITANFKNAAIERYRQCLLELLIELLKKVQFRSNKEWLNEIDMEKLDADCETDWEKFVKPCLDIVEKLSELLPEDTFSECSQFFQGNLDVYFGLSPLIKDNVLNIPDSNLENVHISLLDLSTSFRMLGRLSSLFTEEVNFRNRLEQCKSLIKQLIQGAMFGSFYKTYSLKTSEKTISYDLIEVHAQAIASVQAYSYWLAKCNTTCQNEQSLVEEFQSIVVSILEVISPLFDSKIPTRISVAASRLLVSVTSTVKPTFFLALKQSQQLYADNERLLECPLEIQVLVFKALSDALILPWPSMADSEQEWEARTNSHKNLTSSLYKGLVGIPNASILSNNIQEHTKWKVIIKNTCQILTVMVASASEESKKSRNIVYNSVQEVIGLCSKIIAAYLTETDVADSILNFLSVCVRGLKIQMGATMVEELIAGLLNHLKRDQMIEVVKSGNASGINTLDRFLKMLEMIVQEPDPSFKSLLPSVISFGLDHMLPALNEDSVPDLRLSTLELFHQILFHNWRHFFKSNVLSRMNGEDQLQNDVQFLAVLKVFGQPLLENDISLFRKSIEILESLNTKYHLYQKSIFQSTMLSSFLQVLLDALIQKSHNLLQDEIIQAIYSMVSSNFDGYFSQFIPNYLMNINHLTDHQRSQLHENYKRYQDVPSFTSSLQQFTGDIRYLQNVNNSLPPGTIRL